MRHPHSTPQPKELSMLHRIRWRLSPSLLVAHRARSRLLGVCVLASALLVLAALGAGRAQALETTFGPYSGQIGHDYHTVFPPSGGLPYETHQHVQPYLDQVFANGTGNWWWYRSDGPYGVYSGPKGLVYRMYKSEANGRCLDVKEGAATAGAWLTTAPCEWSRNSQWWAFGPAFKLIPWHAADDNLVATSYIMDEWGDKRLVLAPASGGPENKSQYFNFHGFTPPAAPPR
jgi:hypothetical protein